MLKIENLTSIVGEKYNEVFNIIGVHEHRSAYEFTLGYASVGKPNVETILLHREQMKGMYVMEYNSKTLWLNKNEIDTKEKIIICMQTI